MGGTFIVRSRELDVFRRCRRRWDYGALPRHGLLPVDAGVRFDLQHAVRMGIAVYHLPAMDDWSRTIVRPLALKGFERAMSEQLTASEAIRPATAAEIAAWQAARKSGERLLTAYFELADTIDDLDTLLSDELVWSPVPDPADATRDVGTADGRPVRFVTRIDQLVTDARDEHWLAAHRVVHGDWRPDERLLDDDEQRRAIWALQVSYPQLRVAGSIVTELRDVPDAEVPPPAEDRRHPDRRDMSRVRHRSAFAARLPVSPDQSADARLPDRVVARTETRRVRRTIIRRSTVLIAEAGRRVADDIRAMTAATVDVGPTRSSDCPTCPFLAPCDVLSAGGDPTHLLITAYRRRGDEEREDAGLRRSDERRQQRGARATPDDNVNLRWS